MKTRPDITWLFPFFCCGSQFRLLHQKTNNENNKSNYLGSYLAGLIEGDGSIIVPKLHRNEKGKLFFNNKTLSRVQKLSTMKYNSNKLNPHWVTGFCDGESCFFVDIFKSKTHSLGFQVRSKFIISQNVKDVILINGLKDYFDCGDVILDSRDMSHYVIRKISSISDVLLPFFAKYPLQSSKLADFADFLEVANIINSKAHLTQEGLDRINLIKSGMNRGRNSD